MGYDNDYYTDELIERIIREKDEEIDRLKKNNNWLTSDRNKYKKKYNKIMNSRLWKSGSLYRKLRKKATSFLNDKDNNLLKDEEIKEILYEDNIDFSDFETDVKALALYLPAFHKDSHNDKWWGDGFTEWDNVKKGNPLWNGHNQPRTPHDDFGYYDLSNIEVLKKQVELAKQHGIYGFAMYYYWFSGERILEKPLNLLLEHKEIRFPFMLVWANEDWTRRWDGMDKEVLIEQKYLDDDPERFIADIKKYLIDERYIRIDGKPVIVVYEPSKIPGFDDVVSRWRAEARREGIGEIIIWMRNIGNYDSEKKYIKSIDGIYEFPPRYNSAASPRRGPSKSVSFDYRRTVINYRSVKNKKHGDTPLFPGAMLEWDNSAKRKNESHSWRGYTPELFYYWNCANIAYVRKNNRPEERFVIVNAWNEWGEGSYLEPDKKSGYANINMLSRALFNIPLKALSLSDVNIIGQGLPKSKVKHEERIELVNSKRIAVQAHVFYAELIHEVVEKTNNIPVDFDLLISTCSDNDMNYIDGYLKRHSKAKKINMLKVENRGRDVVPFVYQMRDNLDCYDLVCHIHTKKSKHSTIGDEWRTYSHDTLLGSEELVEQILMIFSENAQIGIVAPDNFDLIKKHCIWAKNYSLARELFYRMKQDISVLPKADEDLDLIAGDMFWARTDAIKKLIETDIEDLIPEESGQVDGTIMHAIERVWIYVAKISGYETIRIRNVLDRRPISF